MARRWLETPEVQRWWGDPDGEISLLEEDLDDPRMTMWIVSHEGRPFAYIQDYDPHAWSLGYFGQPPGARFIDQFIGEPDMIGRGHGSAFIRQHVDGPPRRRRPGGRRRPRPRRTPAPSAPTRRPASSPRPDARHRRPDRAADAARRA
jgi:aminoglycoside 6'-N-acetyltransferase